MRTSKLLFVFLAFLVGSAAGQAYVVDAKGGGNYLDLPAAVAAVPNKALILVRPGLYSGFTITNKSLSIIGDDRNGVTVQGKVVIGPLSVNHYVYLASFNSRDISIDQAACPVVIANITARSAASYAVRIQMSANVHLLGCDLVSGLEVVKSTMQVSHCTIVGKKGYAYSGYASADGLPGIALYTSRLMLVASTVIGGEGFTGPGYPPVPRSTYGGLGVLVAGEGGSQFLAMMGTINGGRGGDGSKFTPGFRGGHGLDVRASVAIVEGFSPKGGYPGRYAFTSSQSWVKDANSQVFVRPTSQPPVATLEGKQTVNSKISFAVSAKPGSSAFLILNNQPTHISLAPLVTGALLVQPLVILTGGVIPLNGPWKTTFTVAPAWPHYSPVHAQYLVYEPGSGALWLSNSMVLLIKS